MRDAAMDCAHNIPREMRFSSRLYAGGKDHWFRRTPTHCVEKHGPLIYNHFKREADHRQFMANNPQAEECDYYG